MSFALGLERALEDPPRDLVAGARFGMLVNQASVDRDFVHAHTRLAARFPGQLRALFGPQHGLWSEQQDNMIETSHGRDPELAVPVYSLYHEQRQPSPDMLEGLDVLVVDLQDVGCRVYTYIWTLLLAMRACADAGIKVLVLDRPNPVGARVEGPTLDPRFESFVGLWPIPMRHGLTIGELARLFASEAALDLELEVVACAGWRRASGWSALGRVWVPSSPNLPRLEGVQLYPGLVLIEGTQLSEGRGTTTPFEQLGAPWIDPRAFRSVLERFPEACAGVAMRPIRFEPTFQKHARTSCGGLFLHPVDERRMRPYALALALLAAARELGGEQFEWLPPPYEYEPEKMPIDILSGGSLVREGIDAGLDANGIEELCAVDFDAWRDRFAAHLLYDDAPESSALHPD